MSIHNDRRINRERIDNTRSLMDRVTPRLPDGTSKFLASVATLGSFPTGTPKVYICNPVDVDISESEGATPSYTTDTTTNIPVVFLGTKTPALGDQAVAFKVGGAWVAESGNSPQQGCCGWFCGGLEVPQYFDVVDPVYGPFRIPLVKSGGNCSYKLDTYLDFQGIGSCPSGQVPVHMVIGNTNEGMGFFVYMNFQGGDNNACTNVGEPPLRTNCVLPGPGFVCGPGNFNFYMTCPTNVTTFPPIPPAGGNCFPGGYNISAPITCEQVNSGSFSISIIIYAQCSLVPFLSNPFYLLYGPCPIGAVTLNWMITAGPTTPIGCGGCCEVACGSCAFPVKNLQIAYTNTNGSGTISFPWTGSGWASACDPYGVMYAMSCSTSGPAFTAIYFTEGVCPTGTQATCQSGGASPGLTLESLVCSPLSLTYTVSAANCPVLNAAGYSQFVISDPSPATLGAPLMCQTVCCAGCTLSLLGTGATVTITDGMTVVASGTISGTSGCVYLEWAGSSTDLYTVTATDGLGTVQSVTSGLVCRGTTQLNFNGLGPCLNLVVGDLSVTVMFSCEGGAPFPATGTLTRSGVGWVGGVLGEVIGPCYELVNFSVSPGGDCTIQVYPCGQAALTVAPLPGSTCDPFMFLGSFASGNWCGGDTGDFSGTFTITPV